MGGVVEEVGNLGSWLPTLGCMASDPVAVLITGVFGSGKSSVVEEMAGILESTGTSHAVLDLDYLWWFEVEDMDDAAHKEVLWTNLSALLDNYKMVGVDHFLLAWAVKDESDLAALSRAMSMPMEVVTLSAPLDVIRDRLSSSPTTDRQRDLRNTERWIIEGKGPQVERFVVDNDRPLPVVAAEILRLIKWISGPESK